MKSLQRAGAILAASLFIAPVVQASTPLYALLSDPSRTTEDRRADATHKPEAVLSFVRIHRGSEVMDLVPHEGYFTRLFAVATGPQGHVYDLVPSEADAYLDKLYPDGLPSLAPGNAAVSNVHVSVAKLLSPQRLDLIWSAESYHDLHTKFFGPADVSAVDAAAYRALKPGGYFVIVDHAAESNSGATAADALHRIDRKLVIREVTAAGFRFVGESKAFAVAADDRSTLASDEHGFGQVDMFLLRFKKPR